MIKSKRFINIRSWRSGEIRSRRSRRLVGLVMSRSSNPWLNHFSLLKLEWLSPRPNWNSIRVLVRFAVLTRLAEASYLGEHWINILLLLAKQVSANCSGDSRQQDVLWVDSECHTIKFATGSCSSRVLNSEQGDVLLDREEISQRFLILDFDSICQVVQELKIGLSENSELEESICDTLFSQLAEEFRASILDTKLHVLEYYTRIFLPDLVDVRGVENNLSLDVA